LTTDPTLTEMNELQAVNPTSLAWVGRGHGRLDAAATTTSFSPSNPFDTSCRCWENHWNDLIDFTRPPERAHGIDLSDGPDGLHRSGPGGDRERHRPVFQRSTAYLSDRCGGAPQPRYGKCQRLPTPVQPEHEHRFTSPSRPLPGIGTTSPQLNLSIPSQVVPQFTTTGRSIWISPLARTPARGISSSRQTPRPPSR